MNDALNTFAKSAENLSKNPLGIIGLFIVLVYGIAGMVLITTNELGESKQYLVWFLIGFPILILWTFYNLVTKHYNKLYAPSDYQDEGNFMKAIDIVTGSIETSEKIIISKDVTEAQESLNTLILIEELQNQIKNLSGNLSHTQNQNADYVEENFKEGRELLEKTRSIANWKGTSVHVNTTLEDSEKLIIELLNNGVGSLEEFGDSSTAIYKFNPDVKLLTIGQKITIKQVKIALELAIKFNIKYVNITKEVGNINGIYFGSYGYSHNQVAKIDDLPIMEILKDDSFSMDILFDIINAQAVYNLRNKALTKESQ